MDHESDVPQHEANEIKLTAFALGELTEAERAAFLAQSLDAAADLQALSEIARVGELIRRARREEGFPERSSELRQTLEARLSEAAAPRLLSLPSRSRPPRHLWLPLSLAASALVIGGTAVALLQVRHADERQIALAGPQDVEQHTGVTNLTAHSRLEDSVERILDAESLDFAARAERRDGETNLKRSKEKTQLGFGVAELETAGAAASANAVDESESLSTTVAPAAELKADSERGFSVQQSGSAAFEIPLGSRAIVPTTGSGGGPGMMDAMGGMGGGMGRPSSQFGGYMAPQRQNTMNYGRPAVAGQPQTADWYYFAKPRGATAGAPGAGAPAAGDVVDSFAAPRRSGVAGALGESAVPAGGASPATEPALPTIAAIKVKGLEQEVAEGIPAAVRFAEVDQSAESYAAIVENPFVKVVDSPLSTFSIDVDTASYAKVRRYLLEENVLPPPDAVRIEELVNYFSYDLPQPEGEAPFAAQLEAAACPWQPKHRLLRVSLKTREIAAEARPAANLVFLLDVSGSMQPEDKLPRVRRAMRLLTQQLREQDRVAIVVYAGSSGLVLPSTSGFQKEKILSALESLAAGGSTNGGEGLVLAYEAAAANFIKQGVNRVILCTDGDFNVGTTSDGDLERLIEAKAKTGVFLTVLGFGMGNHNDQMLEKLADKGNGNYGYIDTEDEARKLLVEQAGGTLVTVAKDVKLQLEFNPRQVAAYRLIGYEDRLLRAEDFNDDHKDAGEIGAGHSVTALYELIPAGKAADAAGDKAAEKTAAGEVEADPLKYQRPAALTEAADSGELLTLKVKYKEPSGETSKAALVFTTRDEGQDFAKASADFKFAAAVASFGMLLRNSEYQGDFSYDAVLEIAQEGIGPDEKGYRKAFLEMLRRAKELAAAK